MSGQPIRIKFMGRAPHDVTPQIWTRQLPGGDADVDGVRFIFDLDAQDYDWLVVHDDLPTMPGERFSSRVVDLACPRAHTMLLTMEPSTIKIYGNAFLSQFGAVISSQEPDILRHKGQIYSQAGLRWYYGVGGSRMLTWDEIAAHPPLDKTKLISTVCSSKRQRHTLHNLRWDFTQELAKLIPELDVFGAGVRAMDDKAEAMSAYKYHVAVENFQGPHHWTEKLSDSFLACTLPFYFGAPNAADYFPADSFIPIDIRDAKGAAEIIRAAIDNNEWEKRLPSIMEARRRALEEHNFFALIAREVKRLDALPCSPEKGLLRSRRAARKANPLATLPDVAHSALRKLTAIVRPQR